MNMQNQAWQSIGQFLIVFVSSMAIYKGFSEISYDAIYQPVVQGLISALGIWGFSKAPGK